MMSQLFETDPLPEFDRFANVAVEQGIDASATGLTYGIGPELEDLAVGDRVIVPLGRANKPMPGYVVRIGSTSDYAKVKRIISRDPLSISLPAELIELAKWIAAYYCCPLGMVFGTMLPAAVKRGTGSITRTMIDVSIAATLGDDDLPKLTKLQKAVLGKAREIAGQGEQWVEIKDLADRAGARSVSPVKQLVAKGCLQTTLSSAVSARADEQNSMLPEHIAREASQSLDLTDSQQKAVDHLTRHMRRGFGVHLLHGVTGSGKTEVYLQVIEEMIGTADAAPQQGQPRTGAIVLVPEIALTPQTMARFLARFEDVAVLHSGLSSAQRHQQWRRIKDGLVRIVVGARSAVFAPLPRVGLIVVDEEHENSYKQDQLPRYHARDIAIKRAQMLGVPVLLGSATPSLESYYNATAAGPGKAGYHLVSLPKRVRNFQLPKVDTIDMVEERRARKGIHLLSMRLESEVKHTLSESGQVMLLLNRRGYANYISCPDQVCGWMMVCEHCDATMVYHKDKQLPTGGVVRCHHCSAEQILPVLCPQCDKKVTVFGLGTQRVEAEIQRKFPHARYLRMDSDVMRTGNDYHRSLEQFRSGEVDILIGTQMIAKGLDFPNVRLVGVISADTSLHLPDFRAGERTFQLIAQVAGRAGRSDLPGRVIVQSYSPQDPAIQFAAQHDYTGFARRELALREEMGLPPVARMARIVVRDRDHVQCYEMSSKLGQALESYNHELGLDVIIRGPMPCPIARVADYHRQQIELIAANAGLLQKLLTALRNARLLISDTHMAVDVDPVSLL